MASTSSRQWQYDLILLGATGYTGKLTAEYITRALPGDLNWAVAGRNHTKLSGVVEGLKDINAERKQPAIEEITDICDEENLKGLVQKARVLITTVGPFYLYGSPVIEACANTGTHYVDCTGETPWIYDIVNKYHRVAELNGAVLVPQCGIESGPADLVAFVLASFIREKYSSETASLVHSIQEFNNDASGGTLHSLIGVASSYSLQHLSKSLQPYSLCADMHPATPHSVPRSFKLMGSHFVPRLGILTDSVIGVPDTTLVYRSWSLLDEGKYYGPRFSYFTGMKAANRVSGLLWHYAMAFALPLLLLPPVRWILLKLVSQPGYGPPKESQGKSFTTWKSLAHSYSDPPRVAMCEMSFPGDMYSLTAILLSEAAMVLLRPDRENWAQKLGGGVLTPATLGNQYVERVKAAGLRTEVQLLEESSKSGASI